MIIDPNRWPKAQAFISEHRWFGPLLFIAIPVAAIALILGLVALWG